MLTTNQRIDLLKIALDIARSSEPDGKADGEPLNERVLSVFRVLREEIGKGDDLGDANMSDVKTAVDVAASLGNLID